MVGEACNDVLEGGVLHIDVLGVSECLNMLLIEKRFWTVVPKKSMSLLRDIALGINVLVMTNGLHLGSCYQSCHY
jgi:hypothetical protein